MLGCATGGQYKCSRELSGRTFSFSYPFGTPSGRLATAWKAICAGHYARADAVLRDVVIDTPTEEVYILIDFNNMLKGIPGASESLLVKLLAHKGDEPEWKAFSARILAATGRYESAWESIQTLPESWLSRQRITDLAAWSRERGEASLQDIGWDAFILEDRNRLSSILDRFPEAWRDSEAFKTLSMARLALESPSEIDPDTLKDLDPEKAEAIRSWLGNRNRSLEDRLSEVLTELAKDPDNPKLNRRLYQLKKRWELSNLLPMFSDALRSEALTRVQFALLIAWQFPDIRLDSHSTPPVMVDLLDRKESSFVLPSLAIGLFPFIDMENHRFEADRVMTAEEIMTSILALAAQREITPCGESWETMKTCGFIPGSWELSSPVSGEEAADLLESLAWSSHGTS